MKMQCRAAAVLTTAVLSLAMVHPALAQDNLRDGAPFNGYTGVKFDTTNYHYDYLVEASLPQDDPAAKKFRTLEAATQPRPPELQGIRP